MQHNQFTLAEIAIMRKEHDIPENFVPVASVDGVIAWATKNSVKQIKKPQHVN